MVYTNVPIAFYQLILLVNGMYSLKIRKFDNKNYYRFCFISLVSSPNSRTPKIKFHGMLNEIFRFLKTWKNGKFLLVVKKYLEFV